MEALLPKQAEIAASSIDSGFILEFWKGRIQYWLRNYIGKHVF